MTIAATVTSRMTSMPSAGSGHGQLEPSSSPEVSRLGGLEPGFEPGFAPEAVEEVVDLELGDELFEVIAPLLVVTEHVEA